MFVSVAAVAAAAEPETSDDPVLTLVGVVIGAAAVIVAQFIAEFIKWRVAKSQRSFDVETRKTAAEREALGRVLDAAQKLRGTLITYEGSPVPEAALEQDLSTARSAFQVSLYQVGDYTTRQALDGWAAAAESWANGNQQRSAEDAAWNRAVQRCGEQIRAHR